MTRLHKTAAALLVLTLVGSGCARTNKAVPNRLAPSRVTTIGVNSYLWRAAVDTLSFAPLVTADSNG